MILIFSFSGQNAGASNHQSGRISQFLCSTFVSGFSDMSEEQQKRCLEEVSYPVRKTAHVSEYAVLALLFFGSIYTAESVHRKKEGPELQIPMFMQPEEHRGEELMKRYEAYLRKKNFRSAELAAGTALLLSIVYAAADEVHQLFVSGRSGSPVDVMIDTAGALLALVVLLLVQWIRNR